MDEQTSPAPESAITTPDPVAANNAAIEPPQAEPALPLTEPVSAPEIADHTQFPW